MLIVENVQLNEDGVSFDHAPIFDNQSSLHRESDLKNMFVSLPIDLCRHFELKHLTHCLLQSQLHELYVRYTMNPFSKLRSPIQSRVFDEGINEMARQFNAGAVQRASAGGQVDDGMSWM